MGCAQFPLLIATNLLTPSSQLASDVSSQGIPIGSPSSRGVAEKAPGAYRSVDAVVLAAERAGPARRVARMRPLICRRGQSNVEEQDCSVLEQSSIDSIMRPSR